MSIFPEVSTFAVAILEEYLNRIWGGRTAFRERIFQVVSLFFLDGRRYIFFWGVDFLRGRIWGGAFCIEFSFYFSFLEIFRVFRRFFPLMVVEGF